MQTCSVFGVFLLLLLFATVLQGQTGVVKGDVKSAIPGTVHITTSAGEYILFHDAATRVWRGRFYPDFSVLQPGDEVNARYRRAADGHLVAVELDANIEHVTGRITGVRSGAFQIDQNFDADPHSAYRRGAREITYNPDTAFENSAPDDLRVGRTVDIIGLRLNSQTVEASRVVVYEGKKPVRMPPGSIVLPDGRIRQSK